MSSGKRSKSGTAVPRLLLVHWNRAEAAPRAQALRAAGYRVLLYDRQGGEGLRELRYRPPDAFVIDLARLPSHGRAVAIFLRQQKATRERPIVFLKGDPQKTGRTRQLLPDAAYTTWGRAPGVIAKALQRAVAKPGVKPVVPGTMVGYSGTPLPRKLGIRAGSRVALAGAPPEFERTVGRLPEGAMAHRGAIRNPDLLLLFVRSQSELTRRFPAASRRVAPAGKLWLCWPKQGSPIVGDINGNAVRAFGLSRGWVDYKICAIDGTWSGLCFARRAERP